jgi:hypothetical protein
MWMDRAVLGRFSSHSAQEELLPLREVDGVVEVAASRLATPGLIASRAGTDIKLRPILAPSEALQREIKKHPESVPTR